MLRSNLCIQVKKWYIPPSRSQDIGIALYFTKLKYEVHSFASPCQAGNKVWENFCYWVEDSCILVVGLQVLEKPNGLVLQAANKIRSTQQDSNMSNLNLDLGLKGHDEYLESDGEDDEAGKSGLDWAQESHRKDRRLPVCLRDAIPFVDSP